MQTHNDEILAKAVSSDATAVPRYNLIRPDGSVVEKNVAMKLANPVAQAGTPINKTVLDEFLAASGVTAGSAIAYTLAQDGYALFDGAPVRFRLHAASGAGATLNINGTGAKPLRGAMGKAMPDGIPAGTWLTATYSAAIGSYILAGGENMEQIEDVLGGERYVVDDAVAHVKDVPADVLTHAEVAEVGGMTRKCTNLIDCADKPITNASYRLPIRLTAGEYILSAFNPDGSRDGITIGDTYSGTFLDASNNIVVYDLQSGVTLSAEQAARITQISIGFDPKYYTGGFDTISYQLNEGLTALPYESYFEGLRSASTTAFDSVGVNLFDPNMEIRGTASCTVKVDNGCFIVVPNGTDPFFEMVDQRLGLKNGRYYFYSKSDPGARVDLWLTQRTHNNIVPGQGYFEVTSATTKLHLELEYATVGTPYTICIAIYKAERNAFVPYFHDTLPIPEAVRALEGYGESNPDDATEYNAIKWLSDGKRIYSHKGNIVDGAWVPLAAEEITDISALLPADNILRVQPGGTFTAVNERNFAVPTTITYERNVLANRASTYAVEELRKSQGDAAKANLSNASGTFGGVVKANATAAASLGTAQVRNVTISNVDLAAGSSALATGESYRVHS